MELTTKRVQKFEWGQLEWISEPDNDQAANKLLIGKAIFQGTQSQQVHYHPDEQVLYVEKGEGVFQIGEQRITVRTGDIHHTAPFCQHKVMNINQEELVLMITYLPTGVANSFQMPNVEVELERLKELFRKFMLDPEIHNSLERIARLTNMSISILDRDGVVLKNSFNQSPFCHMVQQSLRGRDYCVHRFSSIVELGETGSTLQKFQIDYCCQDILRLVFPFSFQNFHLGYIVCSGFLFEKDTRERLKELEGLEKIYQLYPGTLRSTYQQLQLITKNNIYAASNLITSMLENLLIYWLVTPVKNDPHGGRENNHSREINTVIRYIHDHITERITLEQLAGYVGLNASYLSRKFKQEVGKTVIEYINHSKVEKAKELMRSEEEYNFKEIANQLNFSHQSYFNRIFKKVSGVNPSQFESL